MGAAICFSIYKLFDKRKTRDPEGDTSGRSHIWGAVAVTVFGLVLGSLVSLPSNHVTEFIEGERETRWRSEKDKSIAFGAPWL